MIFKFAKALRFEDIDMSSVDIFICASGFEKRSTFFYRKHKDCLDKLNYKLCFEFKDRPSSSSTENKDFFEKNNFEVKQYCGESVVRLVEYFRVIFSTYKKPVINVIVDYSCMNKIMYAALIKFFDLSNNFEECNVFFCYTYALFEEPNKSHVSLYNQPITLFPVIDMTHKRISLILNLGHEPGRAQGLVDFLEINRNDVYLFYPNKESSNEYYDTIQKHNKYLLESTPKRNHFEYEINDISHVSNLLENLCNYLRQDNKRVIVAPLAIKTFSLLAILLSLKFNDLTILRVSDGVKGEPQQRYPDDSITPEILQVSFRLSKQQITTHA